MGEPGTKCRVYGVSSASLQGAVLFPRFLEQMGAKLTEGEEDGAPWIEVESTAELNGIEADLELLPDCAQTLAVVAASASGRTILTGLHTLRVKETDRIDAVVEELKKFGIQATGGEDYMEISGGVPAWNGEPVATYDDHRMAMSFASLVSKVEQFSISDPGVVNKSFPTFWEEISKLDIEVG